jgi:acetyltransferase
MTGTPVSLRLMRPEDAALEQEFVRGLSPQSSRLRFFRAMPELPPKLLHEFTHPDYPRSYAVLATIDDNGHERQVGVARYAPAGEEGAAEFAVTVADEWQGHGIGRRLLKDVTAAAAGAGLRRIEGFVLRDNVPMLKLAHDLGFRVVPGRDDPGSIRIVKDLDGG